ncbi:glycosyltransferase [Porticoccus sp.]|uniref:glycosyltransferase n=1 Tax=Porticoccus sp. TaxID=2024853 RepID=UPI003F6A0C0D
MQSNRAGETIKIVMWGTFDLGKPRVRILERGLIENHVTVHRCHRSVWNGIEDKSQVTGCVAKFVITVKWLLSYPLLIYRYLRQPPHDLVLVPYMGHLDVLILWPFAKLRGVPIVWDAFLSIYNTVVEDRKLIGPRNPLAGFVWAWEWLACRAADLVVLDTAAHALYFRETFKMPASKLAHVFVGAEPEYFPRVKASRDSHEAPVVLFYGQFIPLHGIETIVEAARLSQSEDIQWVIIGSGQEQDRIKKMLEANPLTQLQWIPWVDYAGLSQWISRARVCLGIFGDTQKASMVIPNKVFQILMSGKPLVTRDSPAIRELITENRDGVTLVEPNNPQALYDAVRTTLKQLPTSDLHIDLAKSFSPSAVGGDFMKCLNTHHLV